MGARGGRREEGKMIVLLWYGGLWGEEDEVEGEREERGKWERREGKEEEVGGGRREGGKMVRTVVLSMILCGHGQCTLL